LSASLWPLRAAVLVTALAVAAGCSTVSDEEVASLKGETEALAAELARLKNESELLDRALTNVYREKDSVVDRLNALAAGGTGEDPEAAVDPAAPAPRGPAEAVAQSGGTRVYIAQKGDTLSQIARRNNTTLQVILELNPRLAEREDHMVMEHDPVNLPN
jgi:LysM repeat protein